MKLFEHDFNPKTRKLEIVLFGKITIAVKIPEKKRGQIQYHLSTGRRRYLCGIRLSKKHRIYHVDTVREVTCPMCGEKLCPNCAVNGCTSILVDGECELCLGVIKDIIEFEREVESEK
jgi:hypothetical protein